MKTKSIFWGAFLLSSGIILLLGNYGLVNVYWESVWKLWPIALILLGARAFVQDQTLRGVMSALGGVLLGVSLFSGIFTGVNAVKESCDLDWSKPSGKHVTQQISEPYDSTARIFNFTLDGGVGNFSIGDTSTQLYDGLIESNFGEYSHTTESNDSTCSVTVSMQDNNNHFRWFGHNKLRNRADIHLNTTPLWNIDANLGAAAVQFDLSKYKVGTLSMEVGAASVKVKFGDKADSTHLKFDGGATKIELSIPTNSGCKLEIDEDALNGTDLVGFEKVGENTYQTPNYASATKKITMDFDIGVSKLKVIRY
ncbi:MAG: hypothetical protein JST20_13225 [Bacteroidetes bacterium]|nr:hypothetical protein [Bacteroidota bacterium]